MRGIKRGERSRRWEKRRKRRWWRWWRERKGLVYGASWHAAISSLDLQSGLMDCFNGYEASTCAFPRLRRQIRSIDGSERAVEKEVDVHARGFQCTATGNMTDSHGAHGGLTPADCQIIPDGRGLNIARGFNRWVSNTIKPSLSTPTSERTISPLIEEGRPPRVVPPPPPPPPPQGKIKKESGEGEIAESASEGAGPGAEAPLCQLRRGMKEEGGGRGGRAMAVKEKTMVATAVGSSGQ
ncbi:unnamed protein product [Pleuronectes platessa]|uniref:Uncharacterized protein n=1 Tax=Pleuronectes platessa TaxID=8262 RepID=A0A9N7YKS4_PLEPL|nr:unnamed protein product [Pleuronectes platessa]